MSEHINRGCTNHGCVYHYVYPELAKGMHTNGPCHCNARPIADYLHRKNAQLKVEIEELREHSAGTMQDFADLLGVQPHHCTAWGDLYRRIGELKAELAQCKQRQRMSDLNYDALERVLNDKTDELTQEQQRAARLRELLEKADKLYTSYGLLAQHSDCGPWINNVRAALEEDKA